MKRLFWDAINEDLDGGSDVDEDLGGLKIWAEGPTPPAPCLNLKAFCSNIV